MKESEIIPKKEKGYKALGQVKMRKKVQIKRDMRNILDYFE